ncbi:hypothetical protein FOZ63_034075 [Perkinsus olseni]|uniref:Uncharacterized protein n=2 Tax=Perkinsus olseni TaxID=32597 RepID=A0A7J6PTD0_PEROL|nr:hypothetical protein FOZ63_034075 [Perkinsus olseni]
MIRLDLALSASFSGSGTSETPEDRKARLMSAKMPEQRSYDYLSDEDSLCSDCEEVSSDASSAEYYASVSNDGGGPRGIKRVRRTNSPRASLRKRCSSDIKKRKISCSTSSSDNCHTLAEAHAEGRSPRASSGITEELCGPAFDDHCKCDDPQDPVSLQRIWVEGPDGGRKASDEIEFLFSYYEDDKFIRGFSITTLQYMLRQPRPIQHPVSRKVIPDSVLERAEQMVKHLESTGAIDPVTVRDLASLPLKDLTRRDVQQLSLEVWQLMARQSVYVEEDTLVDMDRAQLLMLNSELRSMFTENFTVEQRRLFYPPDGTPFMNIHEAIIGGSEDIPPSSRSLGAVQGILRDLRTILTNAPENMKFMVSYVIVGALAVVSSPIRAREMLSLHIHDSDSDYNEMYMTGLSHSFEIPPAGIHGDDYSSDGDDGEFGHGVEEGDSDGEDFGDEF